MPGIPLLNLGYGLGGLVQGYQNQQSQGLQQALQRLQLQQAQSQSNAQTLAGLALQAGLLNNPVQTNPLSPINISAPQAPAGGSTSATPPPPGVPVGTTYPPVPSNIPPQQTYTPPSPFSLDDTRSATVDQPPIYGPGPGQPDTSAAPQAPSDSDQPDQSPQKPSSQQPAPAPAPAPASSQNGDTPSRSDTSSAPSPGGGGGGVAAVFPNGQSIDISSMFKTIDYQKLSQGIARLAPPGTSQADIYAAVLDLGKLAEGDKVQQQQAGLIARTLLGGQFKLAGIGMQQEGATGRTELQQAGAGQRTAAQQAGASERQQAAAASRERIAQEQIEARKELADQTLQLRRDAMNIRNANDQARLLQSAQRIAISAQNAGRADSALQISALSRQIAAIKPQPDGSYTDQQQQQLQILSQRIALFAAQAAQGNTPAGP